jgi:hypothetical protein
LAYDNGQRPRDDARNRSTPDTNKNIILWRTLCSLGRKELGDGCLHRLLAAHGVLCPNDSRAVDWPRQSAPIMSATLRHISSWRLLCHPALSAQRIVPTQRIRMVASSSSDQQQDTQTRGQNQPYLIRKLCHAFEKYPQESVVSLLALEITSMSSMYFILTSLDIQFSAEVSLRESFATI